MRKLNWMKGKQGKQNRREHLYCLFIVCIFKFVNLLCGAYPEFTHSVFLFLVQIWCKKKETRSDKTNHWIPSDQPSVVVPENKGSRRITSLQNFCDDPEINKDAVFPDEFQKVLEKNETSVLFKPHLNKMKATFFEARRNLKKRITAKIQSQQREGEQKQQRTDIMDEDDNSIFELLQNI